MTALDQMEEYFGYLLVKGVKETTVRRYRSAMGRLIGMMEAQGVDVDLRTLRQEDVYRGLGAMHLLESSQEAYSYIIKAACRHHGNPSMGGLRVLTNGTRPNARWITDEEFRVLMSVDDITTKVIVHLCGNYGLRRGEVAKLRIGDIRPGYMIVHGKGHGDSGKIRHVPLIAERDPIIEEYLSIRRSKVARCIEDLSDDHLIIYADRLTIRAVRPEGISKRIKAEMERLGIDGTSHSLRREFITSAYRAGNSLVDIMQVVGHTDPSMTMSYIRQDIEQMRSVLTSRNQYISQNLCPNVEGEEDGLQAIRI